MEKKIKLDSKTSITLNNNVGWLFLYKDQFGRDIVPTLVPVLNARNSATTKMMADRALISGDTLRRVIE